jgi:hypothetical protein
MSNGAIFIVNHTINEIQRKRLQVNKKYSYSLGYHNLIFALLSYGWGVLGCFRV